VSAASTATNALLAALAAPAAAELLGSDARRAARRQPIRRRSSPARRRADLAHLVGADAEDGAETVCCYRATGPSALQLGGRGTTAGVRRATTGRAPRLASTSSCSSSSRGRVRDLGLRASPSCPVDARGERLVALDGVDAAASARPASPRSRRTARSTTTFAESSR
jgi:hypothetical protein